MKPPVYADQTINGTKRNDTLTGGEGNDTINGLAGRDYIRGGNGDDVIHGNTDNDSLWGGSGIDILYGDDGNDLLYGEAGDDRLFGGIGSDSLQGGAGDDFLDGGDGDDFLFIEPGGHDTLTGGAGPDVLQFSNLSGVSATLLDYAPGEDLLEYMPNADANPSLAGIQGWQFIGSEAPTSPLNDGSGQATVSYGDGNTILTLYNADGDLVADTTLSFAGTFQPEDLHLMLYDPATHDWTIPAIAFPAA
jgi:Ca2+-binding RTX toxin-like protein